MDTWENYYRNSRAHEFTAIIGAMQCAPTFDFDQARELMVEIFDAIEQQEIEVGKGLLLCDILSGLIIEQAKRGKCE